MSMPIKASIARMAAQQVKLGQAPPVNGRTQTGKTGSIEIYEDLFQKLPEVDNGPTDIHRELGKANFVSNAPQGMNGWDFEYDEKSVARVGSETFEQLTLGEGEMEFVVADGMGVTRTVYNPATDTSTTQEWLLEKSSSDGFHLVPEQRLNPADWKGSPEKKAMLMDILSKLKRPS